VDDSFVFTRIGINDAKDALEEKYSGFFSDCRFQILFEIGLNGLASGFLRDAVVSFTASLERYYEFFILCHTFQNGSNAEYFKKFWRLVSNQSERQYGAFLALASLGTTDFPLLLTETEVSFRNRVVHKGVFPSKADTHSYALSVLRVITSGLEGLLAESVDAVNKAIDTEISERKPQRQLISLSINPFLRIERRDFSLWRDQMDEHIQRLGQRHGGGIIWPN